MINKQINENISLCYIPMTKLKTTTIGVYIHRPLSEAEASANALLPYVLKRGCKKYPNQEKIAKYLENLYGASLGAALIKRGDDQIMYFDAETISDKYAPQGEKLVSELLSLMMSVLFEPNITDGAFDADIVKQEKKNAKDRIAALMNDKRVYASVRCAEEMCKGDAYAVSRLGTAEGVDALTPESLAEHYGRIITSSAINIFICGDADVDAAETAIRAYTDKISFNAARIPEVKLFKRDGSVNEITEKMNVTQGKLSMGFRTGVAPMDGDYPALCVFNSVFGAGTHSKLFNNVREKLSLAYYASSQLEKYKGIMLVNAGIEFKNFQTAYDETLRQLEEIKNGNVTDTELESSIIDITNTFEECRDDQRSLQSFWLGEIMSGTNRDIEETKAAIAAVTKEQVIAVAQKVELDTVYFLTGEDA